MCGVRAYSIKNNRPALTLYKYLLRQCEQLPTGAKQHYKFSIKQSYKQHCNENDRQRIDEIIARAYEDCNWVIKKVVFGYETIAMQIPLVTSGCLIQKDDFWSSLLVYHDRPNVVNRKIIGITQAFFYKVNCTNRNINLNNLTVFPSVIYEVRKLPDISKQHLGNLVRDVLEPYNKNLKLSGTDVESFKTSANGIFISLRILHPKVASHKKCLEVVILNKNNDEATFYAVVEKNVLAPPFAYTIELKANHLRITVDNFEDADTGSANWLVEKLFPKLIKWTEDTDVGVIRSLSLVEIDRYSTLYLNMKDKYGKKLVDIWPENTDPLKFVYEDIAIAAYLICLWEKTNENEKPNFVDLGCGNGLLVYILNQEGFLGYGIDVRKRKIWDLYPDETKLQITTIIPSESSLFPEADWIIGNHSDELTPWIPVIASRSSQKANIFLLPCCSYEFNGKKYLRKDSSKSQYCEYLDYVKKICQKCGFHIKVDKLRIPSTKKTCIVSFGRSYKADEYEIVNNNLTDYINLQSESSTRGENWIENFKPREQVEKVKNCTQLNRTLVDGLLYKITRHLLNGKNYLEKSDGQVWNSGISLLVSKLAHLIPGDELKQLKNECGGIQTLLRNHRYIFEVSAGSVKLRAPVTLSETSKYKNKPCWFIKNHPDGCLHNDDVCMYKH